MGLKSLLPTTKLGWGKAGRPDDFDLGELSTLHNTSSKDNVPPLTSYKSAYIRRQKPTKLARGGYSKYLDNLPE